MISRRSIVQHNAAKASNNWAEESGMRDYIAAGFLHISIVFRPLNYIHIEPQVPEPWKCRGWCSARHLVN